MHQSMLLFLPPRRSGHGRNEYRGEKQVVNKPISRGSCGQAEEEPKEKSEADETSQESDGTCLEADGTCLEVEQVNEPSESERAVS